MVERGLFSPLKPTVSTYQHTTATGFQCLSEVGTEDKSRGRGNICRYLTRIYSHADPFLSRCLFPSHIFCLVPYHQQQNWLCIVLSPVAYAKPLTMISLIQEWIKDLYQVNSGI